MQQFSVLGNLLWLGAAALESCHAPRQPVADGTFEGT